MNFGFDFHIFFNNVDNAFEGIFFADRNLNRHDVIAEFFTELVKGFIEVRVFAIHFVYEKCAGQFQIFGKSPSFFRFDFNAGIRRNDNQCGISRSHCTLNFADEIRITGRVDEIYFVIFPFGDGEGVADSHFAFGFLRLIIEEARAVVNFTETFCRAAGIKAGFQQTCFSGFAVSGDRHISDKFA